MDSDVVIQATGLSKSYMIGHRGEHGVTLREAITRTVGTLVRTTGDLLRGKPLIAGDELEEIWALRDVNFEVRRGEVLGIIGRNGAGKSTLLKVLSRITDPTEGRVEIRGRVASLLEVGTGFHPELTGRENIFLNGAILGMTRAEIRRKFDEIVDFAGVEKFLDTPVKRFSSGMYVRLAFAVAAHLEPEILIVDEVLAVGDAEFQKKCLGKMQDVAGEGRTVLFVSHNLAAVQSLCDRGILIEAGRNILDDTAEAAVTEYYSRSRKVFAQAKGRMLVAAGKSFLIRSCSAEIQSDGGQNLVIRVSIEPLERLPKVGVGIAIRTLSGTLVCQAAPIATGFTLEGLERSAEVTFHAKDVNLYLSGGEYSVDVWVSVPGSEMLVEAQEAAYFEVSGEDLYGTGHLAQGEVHGLVPLKMEFSYA